MSDYGGDGLSGAGTILMKRTFIAAGLLVSLFAMAWAGTATPRSALAPNKCVRYPSHDDYVCVVATSDDGALYWYDGLYTREFYWHPTLGDQTVGEVFYCQNDRTTADRHTDCKGNAPGVPPHTPEYSRRVITLADGCVITQWNVRDTVTRPPAPQQCVNVTGQPTRRTTTAEQRSVRDFWRIMQKVPGQW
jgi:hypothetical protein